MLLLRVSLDLKPGISGRSFHCASLVSLACASMQISPNANPNAFYTELVTAPYVNNAIISTHIYGPSVTHAATNYSGAGLDWRLSYSFGKKTLFVRCTRTPDPHWFTQDWAYLAQVSSLPGTGHSEPAP